LNAPLDSLIEDLLQDACAGVRHFELNGADTEIAAEARKGFPKRTRDRIPAQIGVTTQVPEVSALSGSLKLRAL